MELGGSVDKTQIAVLLAKGLQMIHRVNIEDCPFDRSLNKVIEDAYFNVKHGLVHEADFDQIRKGRKAEGLYEELLQLRPSDEDFVFTHGDYCLPNIMIGNNKISGFIDLHRAGIGDRYRDIALAVRSIKRNLGNGYAQVFFTEYEISEPDQKKIEYYQLADEFF